MICERKMTTKSPAETLGEQAEAVSGGKPMGWIDMAKRLGSAAVVGGSIGTALYGKALYRSAFAKFRTICRDTRHNKTNWNRSGRIDL